jgi:hypothetical protein
VSVDRSGLPTQVLTDNGPFRTGDNVAVFVNDQLTRDLISDHTRRYQPPHRSCQPGQSRTGNSCPEPSDSRPHKPIRQRESMSVLTQGDRRVGVTQPVLGLEDLTSGHQEHRDRVTQPVKVGVRYAGRVADSGDR